MGAIYLMKMSKTKNLVLIGMLTAIALILTFIAFPIFPNASFLKMDFSEIPALLAALASGPVIGVIVELLKNVLHFFLQGSETGIPIGEIANFTAGVLFILPIYWLYRRFQTTAGLIVACVVGTVCMTAFMAILNYYYFLPLYAEFLELDPNHFGEMMKYMIATIIPFNLLKGALDSILVCILLPKMKVILSKMRG